MRTLSTFLAVVFMASLAVASGYQNVQLINWTDEPLVLVVDGANQCTAQGKGGTCTVAVAEGTHHFAAADEKGTVKSVSDHYIPGDGKLQPWLICGPDNADECK